MSSFKILNSKNWFLGSVDDLIEEIRCSGKQLFIVTANLETISKCNRDDGFLSICLSADIIIPDGIGSVLMLKRIGKKPEEKVPGFELASKLLERSTQETKVFLFGSSSEVLEKASEHIKGNITVAGTNPGFRFTSADVVKKINDSEAELLYVALGIPKQEKWIYNNHDKLSKVKVLMGVGGTFDIWAGTKKRAPKWICKIGFEWLWRILSEPFARIPRFMKSFGTFIRIMIFGK